MPPHALKKIVYMTCIFFSIDLSGNLTIDLFQLSILLYKKKMNSKNKAKALTVFGVFEKLDNILHI